MSKSKAPNKIKHPASGGGYVRNADGSLNQVEKPTEPYPGKREMARREEAKKAEAAKEAAAKAGANPSTKRTDRAASAHDQESKS